MQKKKIMFSMESFSDWLLNELKTRDISQSDLARMAGLGRGTISNIMNGTRNVGQDTLTAIARALKLPPDMVFEKAGLLPPRSELSPVKRAAVGLIEKMSEEDAAFIENFLRSYVQSKK